MHLIFCHLQFVCVCDTDRPESMIFCETKQKSNAAKRMYRSPYEDSIAIYIFGYVCAVHVTYNVWVNEQIPENHRNPYNTISVATFAFTLDFRVNDRLGCSYTSCHCYLIRNIPRRMYVGMGHGRHLVWAKGSMACATDFEISVLCVFRQCRLSCLFLRSCSTNWAKMHFRLRMIEPLECIFRYLF